MNMFERSSRRVCEQDASCYGKFKIGSRIGRCTAEVHCFKNQRVTKVWSRCWFQEILILYPRKVERRLRVNGDKFIMSLGERLVPLLCTLIQEPEWLCSLGNS